MHLEMEDCNNNEDSSRNSSDEVAMRSTTSYWTAHSRASEPNVSIEALDLSPHSTLPTLDYGEWPMLTDDKLCSLQCIIVNNKVPAHIPLPRAIPIGIVDALFNYMLSLNIWVIGQQEQVHPT